MITVALIILVILFCAGAPSIDRPAGPRSIGQHVCEKLFLAIMSVWAVGATLVQIAMCIALLLFLCKFIGLF
jgi:multisubunit Na+/H+ antiporter MnhF subunit